MSGAHRHTAEIYGFQGELRKGEIYVRKMWLSSSFISQFCNGKQAFYKHIHIKPSMKCSMNFSALTKNRFIKTDNNSINNVINHTPCVTSHLHPPTRGEGTPLRSKAAASLSSSILHSVCIHQNTLDPSDQQTDHKHPLVLTEAVVHYRGSKYNVELHHTYWGCFKSASSRQLQESPSWTHGLPGTLSSLHEAGR